MGRENMEDYSQDFLVMLNAWEAGIKFATRGGADGVRVRDIAKQLGWIREANQSR